MSKKKKNKNQMPNTHNPYSADENKRPGEEPHHYIRDLACPACYTDSTVGCIDGLGPFDPEEDGFNPED